MTFERRVKGETAALEVRVEQGYAAAIDDAADAADPRRAFLGRAWFEGAGAEGATTLVAERPGGSVVAALPAVPAGPRLLGMRAVPGSYWPFRSVPVAADASVDELALMLGSPAARRALGRAFRLGPAMADDPALPRLLEGARRSGWAPIPRSAGTAWIFDIEAARASGPWPRPSTLKNNAKHRNRLAKLGPLDFSLVSGSGWTAAAFDALAEIERNAWVGSRADADAKFVDPARRRFWEAMARDERCAAMMSAGMLRLGDRPIAFSFGIDAGGVRYSVATSYDQEYARHSPGYLIGYWTYAEAAERGVKAINLGSGDGGAKASMGAVPDCPMTDWLFVRGGALAALLKPLWARSGS